MYYCNEFLSLNVLSLYEGELIGVVDKLYFDKKMRKLIQLELIGDNDTRLILPTKNIYHIGKNAITVKNNQAVSLKVEESEYCLCPINSKAYTIKGEYLGIVREICINEKFLTEKFSLDNNQTISIKSLASCGKNTIIFYDENDKVNVNKFIPNNMPKLFKTEIGQPAKILPIKDEEEKEKKNVVALEDIKKPTIQNADFLIGRICTKDIFNFNNELLIKEHAVINKKNLKEINKYGKLRELMLYCK